MADKKLKIEKLAAKSKWKNIATFLQDKDMEVRIAAIEAIAPSEDPQYAQVVAFNLNDADPRVRIAAANCLAHIGSNREIESIRTKMANEPDEAVKTAYHDCLRDAKGGKREKTVYNPDKY